MSEPNKTDPSPATGEPSSLDKQGAARRRLLLQAVAAGVPTVITLIGGRRAMASSFTNCIQQLPVGGHGDGGRCLTGGTDLGHDTFVEGSDTQYDNPTAGARDNYLRRPETDTNVFNADVNGIGGKLRTDWCIVYVDGAGALPAGPNFGATGLNDSPDGTHFAMTRSCWGSIT